MLRSRVGTFGRGRFLIGAILLLSVAPYAGAQQSASVADAAQPDGRLLRAATDTMYFSADAPGAGPGNGALAVSRITRATDARRLTLRYILLEPGKPTYRIETVVDNRTLKPIEQIVSRSDTVLVTLRFRDDSVAWERQTPGQPPVESGPFPTAPHAYSASVIDEVVRALPLRPGFHTDLSFYYYGLQRELSASVNVSGSETLRTRSGRPIECWTVTVGSDAPIGDITFWIDKTTRDLIRVDDGHQRYER
jgi:hypothetical protein